MKKFDSRVFLASLKRETRENCAFRLSLPQIAELLTRKDADFIKQAYRMFLGRDADPQGLKSYLPRTRHLPGKLLFLISLYFSPERPGLPPWLMGGITSLRKIIPKRGA